jgi:hypothetical protein
MIITGEKLCGFVVLGEKQVNSRGVAEPRRSAFMFFSASLRLCARIKKSHEEPRSRGEMLFGSSLRRCGHARGK